MDKGFDHITYTGEKGTGKITVLCKQKQNGNKRSLFNRCLNPLELVDVTSTTGKNLAEA